MITKKQEQNNIYKIKENMKIKLMLQTNQKDKIIIIIIHYKNMKGKT